MKTTITQKRLEELLYYDPETGVFTWLVATGRVKVGDIAGCFSSKGYRLIKIDGKMYRSSRLAWLYMESYWPEHEVDHRDRVRSNDKWENLRHATHQCNNRNKGVTKANTSGVVGVCFDKRRNKWRSHIMVSGKSFHLGYFANLAGAAKARWQAEKKYNYPNCNITSSALDYLKGDTNLVK